MMSRSYFIESKRDTESVNRGGCKYCNGKYHTTFKVFVYRYHTSDKVTCNEIGDMNFCPCCGRKVNLEVEE